MRIERLKMEIEDRERDKQTRNGEGSDSSMNVYLFGSYRMKPCDAVTNSWFLAANWFKFSIQQSIIPLICDWLWTESVLRYLSGADTRILKRLVLTNESTKALKPGASIPSSFVIRIVPRLLSSISNVLTYAISLQSPDSKKWFNQYLCNFTRIKIHVRVF